MSKIKTRKTVNKRFKITKTGKVMRGRQMGRHLRFNKSKRRIRKFKEPVQLFGKLSKSVKRLIPYA